MSPVAHALASENKVEKDGPSFSSSVGDFGGLFLAVEISAISSVVYGGTGAFPYFGIFADVSIFGTGLGRFRLVIFAN